MSTGNSITLRGVSKSYGSVRALADLSLEIPEGAAMAVLGENGAGKTTMIRVILGLAARDSGWSGIRDTDSRDHLARRKVRYLPERVQFPEWATPNDVFRHIERVRHEATPADLINRANELECGDLLGRKFGKMSKGQRQRLALALATAGRPDIAILDEPSSGLDPMGRILVRKTVARLASGGTTILLCSHLLGEVEQVCTHAAFLNKGRLVANDSLGNLSRFTGAAEIQTQEPGRMTEELGRAGFSCRTEQGSVIAVLEEEGTIAGLAAAAADSGVPFTGIQMKRETLEDVFMRVTERGEQVVP
jgi:ABC-type multidrug transport system ATPase subunit